MTVREEHHDSDQVYVIEVGITVAEGRTHAGAFASRVAEVGPSMAEELLDFAER